MLHGVVAWSVLVTRVSCCVKTAEVIDMPFEEQTRLSAVSDDVCRFIASSSSSSEVMSSESELYTSMTLSPLSSSTSDSKPAGDEKRH